MIHRMVGGDAETGFVTKGDNNEQPDPWRPRPADIEGAPWIRLPGGGRVIEFLAQPVSAAIVVGALTAFWLLVGDGTAERRSTMPAVVRARQGCRRGVVWTRTALSRIRGRGDGMPARDASGGG